MTVHKYPFHISEVMSIILLCVGPSRLNIFRQKRKPSANPFLWSHDSCTILFFLLFYAIFQVQCFEYPAKAVPSTVFNARYIVCQFTFSRNFLTSVLQDWGFFDNSASIYCMSLFHRTSCLTDLVSVPYVSKSPRKLVLMTQITIKWRAMSTLNTLGFHREGHSSLSHI